jgi:hypothetical protein
MADSGIAGRICRGWIEYYDIEKKSVGAFRGQHSDISNQVLKEKNYEGFSTIKSLGESARTHIVNL